MDASPAPRRLDMDDSASTMSESPEAMGDDTATLELVWRLQREEDARFAEREAADARFGGESPGGGDAHGALSEEEAESLALAIRLQQEEDDAALRAVLGPAAVLDQETRDGASSPSQYSYETLMRLGEALGEVSKGASAVAIASLRTVRVCAGRADASILIGEQCSICRMEFEAEDELMCLPCGHAEHGECVGEWLARNRSCPLCQRDIDA